MTRLLWIACYAGNALLDVLDAIGRAQHRRSWPR